MIDTIFISVILFFISFVWLRKYIKNAILCFLICNLISICLFFVIFKYMLKKYKINNLKNKELKESEKVFLTLKYMDDKSLANYFEKLMNAKQIAPQIYEHNDLYFYIEPRLPLSETDFLQANNFVQSADKQKPLCFVSKTTSNEFLSLLENSPVKYELYTEIDLYTLIKETKIYPFEFAPQTSGKKQKLSNIKNKIINSLTKNHFKDFFISGLSLIVLSIFIPFSKYYMIFGSILLVLSVASLFIKNKNPTNTPKNSLSNLTQKK